MKKAFTLIELLISIVILSILVLFLYQSYASLNRSNDTLAQQREKITKEELLRKTLYLDFSVAFVPTIKILHQSKTKDVVFLQSPHSVHDRINPYIAYIVKDKTLYRLESLKPFKKYPLTSDSDFVVDTLGKVKIFRVYKSKDKKNEVYLLHVIFEKEGEILLKVKVYN